MRMRKRRRWKASLVSGGEKSQSLLQVSHGCAHVLVLKSAASVFTQLLSLGEVISGEMHSWREREETGLESLLESYTHYKRLLLRD